MVPVFQPKVEVRLIKTARRSTVGGGLPAAQRFAELDAIDLTPYLITGEPVTVQKGIGGVGGWSCDLADKMVPGYNESLYGLIEHMDMIEIRMAREPHKYGGKLPIMLRGFVSSIDRSRTMVGGQIHRRVHLGGHDFSKVLDILRIYYLNNSAIGDNIIGGMSFFQKYAELDNAKIMSGEQFAQLVLDKVINPFIDALTKDSKGASVGAAIVKRLQLQASITGTVSPLAVSTFSDGPVRQFLSQYLDVGAFNEMFVEDREEESVLVIRPNHFLTLAGDPVQLSVDMEAVHASMVKVPDELIESITEGRTDAGVANYYWVTNAGWTVPEAVEVRQLAASSSPEQYALFNYVNTSPARFGFRKMEVSSSMGPPGLNYGDALHENQVLSETNSLIDWLTERRRILAEQNRDNAVLEDGQIVMAGNEKALPGRYIEATFGAESARYYAVATTHQIAPNGTYRTIVQFERGTNFVKRAQKAQGSYLSELNLKGNT